MNLALPAVWQQKTECLTHAFQPIAHPVCGTVYAVEALLRNADVAGFTSIGDLFDAAYADGVLFQLENVLRKKVIDKFTRIPFHKDLVLFYNYDHRILESPGYIQGVTEQYLADAGLHPGHFCLELSERNPHRYLSGYRKTFERARKAGFKFAVDDFGVGVSNFELLYHAEPDYIKLDRFFITDIDTDARKRSYAEHIISIAKLSGIVVVGEGVEQGAELSVCAEIGCDLAQGYYLQRPQLAPEAVERRCVAAEVRAVSA